MCFFISGFLIADQGQTNILLYKDNVQVTSEINQYENIVAGMPIKGSVLITHYASAAIDPNSFKLGDEPLSVEFEQNVQMFSYSDLEITIYRFQLPGKKAGIYNLKPIQVKVNGKIYQAPPLTVEVPPSD